MKCPQCGYQDVFPRNPVPTVDAIIEIGDGIVLIKRKNKPYGWALPGGFVEYGESYEEAAVREAQEETGLDITLIEQFHTYSKPGRDPRMHTATTVFIATAKGKPQAGDDAGQAKIFTIDEIPELTFDHKDILDDYFNHKRDH